MASIVVAMLPYFILRNIWFRMMSAVDANAGLFSYRQVKPADAMASHVSGDCVGPCVPIIAGIIPIQMSEVGNERCARIDRQEDFFKNRI